MIPSAPLSATGPAIDPSLGERAKLKQAATAFEAIFVRQMLASARKTSFGDELFGSEALDTFRQMQDERFADIAAQQGTLGLAAQVEAQLSAHIADSLSRLREGSGVGDQPDSPGIAHPQPLPQAGGGKAM
ncbi:MAG: rod-binding protein [Sphingomonadales bacterium]|nr:rod-binding protein [Sphingomonadales bacterium]MDE2569032.1 rod-binding protein [Sphingomonadales bacterium]